MRWSLPNHRPRFTYGRGKEVGGDKGVGGAKGVGSRRSLVTRLRPGEDQPAATARSVRAAAMSDADTRRDPDFVAVRASPSSFSHVCTGSVSGRSTCPTGEV